VALLCALWPPALVIGALRRRGARTTDVAPDPQAAAAVPGPR